MNHILILAEHDQHGLKTSTLSTLNAAKQLTGSITLLFVGSDALTAAIQATTLAGIDKILVNSAACYDHGLAENISALVIDVMKDFNYLLAPATTFGKNILPRIAALLDIAMISEIQAIVNASTFKRPIYAGNAIQTVEDLQVVKIISIRPSSFSAVAQQASTPVSIEHLTQTHQQPSSQFVDQQLTVSTRPELSSARVIISGGRALQSKENFEELLNPLASKLNAAIGASRAAVDAGFAPNDYQVGQTGKIVAPELYIAIGISGAIQHMAGMKDSKVIVAINKDADASIFQSADYGLVGDLYQIIPELTEKL